MMKKIARAVLPIGIAVLTILPGCGAGEKKPTPAPSPAGTAPAPKGEHTMPDGTKMDNKDMKK
jgi:hypothetical protein